MDKKTLKRLRLALLVVIAAFIVLSGRLAFMQVVRYEQYWTWAENQFRKIPITAPRGEIFDRNGTLLVANRPGFAVSLVDLGSGYSSERIRYLSGILEMDEDEIRERIENQWYRRYLPVRLKTDVPFEIVSQIAERRMEYPGIHIEVQPIRDYLQGSLAAHIFGYLGEGDMPAELIETWEEQGYSYRPGDLVGQAGLERVFEPFLRGQDGEQLVMRNSVGQAIAYFDRIDPQPGNNLLLTLDAALQEKSERILADIVSELREDGNSYAGNAAAVALDPQSGRILAMVSYPGYNPNTIREDYLELLQDTFHNPLHNKAIAGTYPIGSTFKMVTALAVLNEGKAGASTTINCSGSLTRYGDTKYCYDRRAHGRVDMIRAMQVSCNVYFYEMGLRAGIDSLAEYAELLGLGVLSGLQDIPGERQGAVASREYKLSRFNEPWWPAETMSAAIGQTYRNFTPLQLANYAAIIANGGIRYRPYLVERIVSPADELLFQAEPEEIGRLDLLPEHLSIIRQGMAAVMRPGGTAGYIFRDFPVEVAGKTGSAQVARVGEDLPAHSLFVGYAPLDDPEIALAVIIEHGGIGSTAAVPVAHRILGAYFGVEEKEEAPMLAPELAEEAGDSDAH